MNRLSNIDRYKYTDIERNELTKIDLDGLTYRDTEK